MTDRSPHHCSFAYALSACVVASFAILVSLGSTARASGQELSEDVGERFYRRGILASGLPAEALLADGSMVPATGLPCVSCHQRSGFGSSEGGVSPPPITWLSLTLPRDPDVRSPYLSRSRAGEARPGYDADRFALAVRNGIDPSGRRLDAVMPRYDVDDETLAALIRHLEGLTPHAVPGIDEEEIHFATVIGPAVPADLERQMLSVLDGFAGAKNAESRNETARARRGVFYQDTRNEAHRRWVIHPWRLHGSPESWPAQLELLLQQRPVFALISGLTRDTYSPVDGFCLRHSIPCILPNSDLPPDDPSEGQTIWISHGFRQEASLLVSDLRAAQIPTGASIEVIYRPVAPRDRLAAELFAQTLLEAGYRSTRMSEFAGARKNGSLDPAPDVVVALGGRDQMSDLAAGLREAETRIYFSGIQIESATLELADIGRGYLVLHPFQTPDRLPAATRRGRVWLAQHGLAGEPTRVHLDTYLAAVVTASALRHIRTNFSRAYMIELVEHGLESNPFQSVYPRLSLGRGQRIGSKTGRVLSHRAVDPGMPPADRLE